MSQQDYRNTLNLPQTDFPMRAGLPKREPEMLTRWQAENLYQKMCDQAKAREKFILHCGPPYANGHLHMGHTLSYVLKDFVVRSRFMMGFNAPFVAGWDCHGLPIEWKVEQQLRAEGKSKDDLSLKQLRDLCRAEAAKWAGIQSEEWQRFGCVGNWDAPYRTMDATNEAGVVREIGKMATNGYLYKGAKSVMWSTVEQTALAEAEVEYADKESTAVYVKFPIVGEENVSVVIWTTTPWTLPANRAVAFGETIDYVAVKVTQTHEKATAQPGETLWFARELLENSMKMCGIEGHEEVAAAKGKELAGKTCMHPFFYRQVPLLAGFHVNTEAGTGFVHIAPAHGAEDFQIGLAEGLDVACPVKGDGTYDDSLPRLQKTGVELKGLEIWPAQKKIIAEMTENGSLLRWYKMTHSYPISWRSKAPLIFRATPQWFIAMDGKTNLREKALAAIKNVRWVPSYGENRITAMIAGRPDWCVSRQRAWGVPITVFRNKKTGDYVFEEAVFSHIADKMEALGIDAWETLSTEELLPAGWLEAHNLSAADLEKETDILDVWIDSGTTHAHVLRTRPELMRGEGKKPANLYLEGSDQHRGWFHSSLLTSVAVYGDAPYEQVLTHGFVVDGNGRKMSKSLGNVVAPKDLLGKYGMDIVRLWVAASDYAEDVRLSDEIMAGTADAYRRFRNSLRWLLGNLNGFDPATAVPHDELPELERFILARFATILAAAKEDYENYRFHRVFHALHNFCAVELSALYFDIRKDTLYCDGPASLRRRASQTVLHHLLKGLCTWLAPIMPFTADEAWRAFFGEDQSVHLQTFHKPDAAWKDDPLLIRWQQVLELRREAMVCLEAARAAGTIGAGLEAKVSLAVPADLHPLPWAELLVVSTVEFLPEGSPANCVKAPGEKCPRCWTFSEKTGANSNHPSLCPRCAEAVENQAEAA